jgi:PAS domain S-box-containing protein
MKETQNSLDGGTYRKGIPALNDSIRILLVEDFPPDVELTKREIIKTLKSCIFRLVETQEEYVAALKEFKPDIIITDYHLPHFDGLTALKLAIEQVPLTPIIVLTSAINEDTAVDCMKKGAVDYVIKEHIKRLGQAVVHALEEKQSRIERHQAKETLRESEERFRSLYENSSMGIYRTSPEGHILMANPAAIRILGFDSFQELAQRDLETSGFKNTQQRKEFRLRIEHDGYISGFESIWLKKDGSPVYIQESARALRNEKGDILYYDGTFEDITTQKKAKEALALLSHTVKSIGECISITDLKSTILFVNEAFTKTYGYSELDVLGKSIDIILCDNTVNPSMMLSETLKGGWQGELNSKRKDGTVFPVFLSTSTVYDDGGSPIALVGVATDLTEQKKLQSQILQAQKIQSIGTLAGGVAHDFNNILGIIFGYTSLIEKKHTDPEMLANGIAAINQAAERGAALVRQILTFARKTETSFQPLSIPDLGHELLSMLKQTFPKTITFLESYENDLPEIIADRTQMHQVLLNLFVNARDAMPHGGTIKLRAELQSKKIVQKRFPSADQETYMCLTVSDTGEGMDETTHLRIFDPFFTTKDTGKGTGLGLSVVYGVMQTHRGYIDVESQLGYGTTFLLFIPTSSNPITEMDQEVTTEGKVLKGSETVLIVEDEVFLVDIIRSILDSNGYQIYIAQDGEEALETYQHHKDEIDIVLTDIGLPKISGIDVLKKLKQINPEIKVLLASGFILPETKVEIQQLGAIGFIQKPYLPQELLAEIRKAIDA